MEVEVFASKINKTNLYFECPFCRTSYFKNGKPIVHIHGSCNDLSNRIEWRQAHCDRRRYTGQFIIHITDDTIREI